MTCSTSVGEALEAFILEHQYCGDLDGVVEGDRVGMTSTCGAMIVCPLEPAA